MIPNDFLLDFLKTKIKNIQSYNKLLTTLDTLNLNPKNTIKHLILNLNQIVSTFNNYQND